MLIISLGVADLIIKIYTDTQFYTKIMTYKLIGHQDFKLQLANITELFVMLT